MRWHEYRAEFIREQFALNVTSSLPKTTYLPVYSHNFTISFRQQGVTSKMYAYIENIEVGLEMHTLNPWKHAG
jgi:hypothetical protein